MKADDQGQLSGTTKQHYPKGNQTPIDLYGLHGDFDPADQLKENDTPFPKSGLMFKVETDQTETDVDATRANHDLSDLLYGIKKNVAPQKEPINIVFVHMLSNVSIVLKVDVNSTGIIGRRPRMV